MMVSAEQSNAIVSPRGGPNGGPSTREGKEVAKWNATRHGIRSPAPVVPGVEKAEDWEEHRDGVLESLQPEGHLELVLAERVALLSWRLNRVTRFETATIALSQEKMEDDLADKRRFGSYLLGPSHPEDVRGALQDALRAQRLIKRFPKLPDDKGLSGPDAASNQHQVGCREGRARPGEDEPRASVAGREDPGEGCQIRGPPLATVSQGAA